jgi:hypothetical protein
MSLILAAVVGVGAASLLISAGYLLGARRGAAAREKLRRRGVLQAQAVQHLRSQLSQRRSAEDDKLRATIEQVLSPLVQRERLSLDLSHLEGRLGQRGDLTQLLDQIADKGNFTAVLLSDNEGWPVAASANAGDIDRLGATASLLLLIAERLGQDGNPAPLSLMLHDGANRVTLCRLFQVKEQRLALTAVATAAQLTPTSLDPALAKVDAILANRDY